MFNLPPGNSVDTEADLSVGQDQMPFETGVISHYKPLKILQSIYAGLLEKRISMEL